jgi:Rrf2 family protein
MITTRGRYALRIMIDLAENEGDGFVPLKEIAERQELPKKYLEIIARDLVAGGLITGSSGKHGGYMLSRKPEEYTLGEIIELMEGTLSPVACLADSEHVCSRKPDCKTLSLWEEYSDMIRDFFYSKKLSDLL